MRLNVVYDGDEPAKIESEAPWLETEYVFTIEGSTARLVGTRARSTVCENESSFDVMELNQVHDGVLNLPFIDRCTVWMKGRTDTEPEGESDQ